MEIFGVYLLLAFLQLTVAQRLPEITYISQEQIKDIGSTVDLQCSVKNAQDFPVLWVIVAENPLPISSGTALIIRDNRYSLRYDTASLTYTLQIKDIQETDAAFYQCQILISLKDSISAKVELQVRSQPVISDNSTRSLVTSEETNDPICPPACSVALNATTETPLSSSTLPPTTAPTSTVSDSVGQRLPTITYISQEQIKDIGSTVDLQCSVENAQDFPVVWLKAAQNPYPISFGPSLVIPDNRFSIRYINPSAHSATYTLQIKDIQEADVAFYRCEIMMSADKKISAEVELQVRSQPVISDNSTRSLVTSEGQSVQLQCYASGHPHPRISWRRENIAILPTGGSIYRGNTLEISSIQKEDRGIYYCVAENGVGRSVRLAITVEVEFVPVISTPRLRVGQALHYDADLECLVEAYPPPAIIWMKDEIQLHDNQHHTISQFSTIDQFTDINLRLMTIEKQQYGLYICRATNKLGTSEAAIELFETIDPVCPPACGVVLNATTETPLYLNETTETSIFPNETTETPLSSSTLPPTTAPTSTDSDSVAQRLPQITYISQEQIADVGGTVDLQCSVENAGDGIVVWVKATRNHYIISVGSLLLMHDSRLSIRYDKSSTSSGTYTLQIRDIQEADAAFYRCEIVTSSNTNISAAVELQVHSKPVISHNSTGSILASEGQNVQLQCYASGYPRPIISWRRENNAILPTGGIIHRGDTLEVSSIRKEDRGIYYCFAENGVERGVRRAIAVHVEFSPVVSVPRLRVGQALRYNADLECLVEAYPPPEITWFSGEVELSNNRHYIISNFATADEITNANIRVIAIEKQQYGQYNCRAVNKLGTSEARIELFETSTPICPPACSVSYNEANETLSSSSTPPSLSSSE